MDIQTATRNFSNLLNDNTNVPTYIGQGFYNCFMPPIVRNSVFCNPKWYTSYTPY